MNYYVHVHRLVRLRAHSYFRRGPFRFRWYARFVAWWWKIDGDNITQKGFVTTSPKDEVFAR